MLDVEGILRFLKLISSLYVSFRLGGKYFHRPQKSEKLLNVEEKGESFQHFSLILVGCFTFCKFLGRALHKVRKIVPHPKISASWTSYLKARVWPSQRVTESVDISLGFAPDV